MFNHLKNMTDVRSTGSQGMESVFLRWVTLEKYVNEMFKVQNLKIFCNFSLTSMVHEWVMFFDVILMVLVMICALVVLLTHIIIETVENQKHQRKLQQKTCLKKKTSIDSLPPPPSFTPLNSQ